MAGGKETPRQKMIGMMYLVLTAMLALNVSKQVLNAFAVVNDGLKLTNKNYDQKNQAMYDAFAKAMQKDPARTKKYNDNAMLARKLSAQLCTHIDSLKMMLISATNGESLKWADTTPLMQVDESSKGNFDKSTHIMIGAEESGDGGLAHQLKLQMLQYRKTLLGLLDKPGDSSTINIGLNFKGGYDYSGTYQKWEVYNFDEQPLASAVTTLTRLQNEVKNAETSVVQKLYQSITGDVFIVDKFTPVVLTPSNYVLLGDSFHSQIFLAASQKTKDPQIFIDSINGKAVDKMKVGISGGKGIYSDKPTTEGEQKFAGRIGVQDPTDPTGQKMMFYPFRSTYLAAKPSVVVSPSKMNVFYMGVDNPVDISAAGFANSAITPSFNAGTITKDPKGGYIVRITPGTKPTPANQTSSCGITVMGTMSNGQKKALGPPTLFRIKRVPDPCCYFAGKKGDIDVTKGELSIATQVQARMDNFDFDLKYNVTGFKMALTVGGNTVEEVSTSNLLTEQMKSLMKKVVRGTHIIIENVHVSGPDGARTIPGVNITVD